MKKLLSLALTAALLCSLGAPAAAAEAADTRLSTLTEKVKTTLGLDTSAYEKFQGDLEENLITPVWRLQWSSDGRELNVTSTEDGRILSYYRYHPGVEGDSISRPGPVGPTSISLPKLSRAQAQKTAETFLGRVLSPGVESALIEDQERSGLAVTEHSFYGQVLEHGLTSPFRFYISVSVEDNAVTAFSLQGEPQNYLGGIPSPVSGADQAKAGEALKSTQELYLEYVLVGDSKTAVLRYLPKYGHEFYVDAKTGALVDLTELGNSMWNRTNAQEAAEAPSATADKEAGLTPAELEGVSKLEGVLSTDTLDAAARKLSALGLGKYTLAQASFQRRTEAEGILAQLQYAYKNGDKIWYRTVSLDAKTAALEGVYSSRPWDDKEKVTFTLAQAQTKAEDFLKRQRPDQFAHTALYSQPDGENTAPSFQYAQKENGYFLASSSLTVEIDRIDGSVSGYYHNFQEDLSFQSADGIVDMDAARSAWFGTYAVTLGYLAVPEKLDLREPKWKPLLEQGRSYLYTQKLAYTLTREGWYQGVDAKTGKPVFEEQTAPADLRYNDLANHWVRTQAQTLAEYGVGWLGGSLKPSQVLTQRDLVALLVSTGGYLYDGSEESAEGLYQMAYSMGILKKADRADAAVITRAQMVKLLLDRAGYSNIAGLEGIFTVRFSDGGSIPAQYLGYAAVAQALGVVKGDQAGNFAPARPATRAEAVSVLYQLMSR